MIPHKRKFEFDSWDGLCDVYVSGMKVREAHAARHGHVYLHLPSDYPAEKVSVEPFDPRVKIQGAIVDGEVVGIEKCREAESREAAEAKKQAELKAEAMRKRAIERTKREVEAKKIADARVAASLAAKAQADAEAAAAAKEAGK